MPRHLAPWHTIIRIEAYYGNISEEDTMAKLKDEPDGTYIITNYDPEKRGMEFTLTVRNRRRQEGIFTIRTLSFSPYRICHMISPKYAHQSHVASHCVIPRIFERPLKKKYPPTLKEIARAVISKEFDYDTIIKMRERGEIPRACADFVTERASENVLSCASFLFCNMYPSSIHYM